MIKLGKEYKDQYSGYVGIATARTVYLYGCVRVCLESKKLKEDGSPQETWFDEQRLTPAVKKSKSKEESPGGPGGPVAPQRSVSTKP